MTLYACSMLELEQNLWGIVTSGTATWRLELLSVAIMPDAWASGEQYLEEPVFERSHRVLDGVLKQRKERGEEPRVEHKAAISEEDMERLKEYFRNVTTECDPVKLSQYCWFYLTLHFAIRGAEIHTKLRR